MINELDYELGGHFKGCFVAKNSNMTPKWHKHVWVYGELPKIVKNEHISREIPKNVYLFLPKWPLKMGKGHTPVQVKSEYPTTATMQ